MILLSCEKLLVFIFIFFREFQPMTSAFNYSFFISRLRHKLIFAVDGDWTPDFLWYDPLFVWMNGALMLQWYWIIFSILFRNRKIWNWYGNLLGISLAIDFILLSSKQWWLSIFTSSKKWMKIVKDILAE